MSTVVGADSPARRRRRRPGLPAVSPGRDYMPPSSLAARLIARAAPGRRRPCLARSGPLGDRSIAVSLSQERADPAGDGGLVAFQQEVPPARWPSAATGD